MKKQILSFLTAACLICSFLPSTVFAEELKYTYAVPGTKFVLTYTLNANGNANIIDCNRGFLGALEIPKQIDGHLVTYIASLGAGDFGGPPEERLSCTSVIIPDSVTGIGRAAFYYRLHLKTVSIPDSVAKIEELAFGCCEALEEVVLPDSVVSLGPSTFSDCASLTAVTLSNSMSEIEHATFLDCKSLEEIIIPNSITSIGVQAFDGCTALKSITLPSSIVGIYFGAFMGCSSLEEIIIPNSVSSIGSKTFSGCSRLSKVDIGNSVRTIEEKAFFDCAIKRIELPKSIVSIGEQALGYITGPEKLNGFTISGYCGTAAETYATENGFTFERIHDPIDIEATLPTCTEPGMSGGTKCAGCGEILSTGTTVIPPTGHTPRTLWERDSSEHYHICSVCGEKTDIADHTYSDWTVKQEPTATVTGWKERTCTVCNYIQRESIPATGEVPSTPTPTPTSTPTSSPSPTPTPTSSPSPTPTSTPTPSRPSGSSGSSSSRSDTYSITPPAASEQGSIAVSPQRAEVGDRVTVTVTPNEGYRLDTLAVKDRQGRELQLTQQEDGTYTFLMPSGPITIEAEFFLLPVEVVMPSLSFTDIPDDSDYRDAVEYVYGNGLMNGTSETTFEPETETSRAMLVTILYRMEGEPAIKTASGFSDVPDGQWYTDAVNWAVEAGIITGFEDNTFRPEELVTKEHLTTILYRYADYKGYDTAARESLEKYLDRDIVSPYAQDAMSWAEAKKLLDESEVRTLSPGEKVRRRWIATMIMKFCENVIG